MTTKHMKSRDIRDNWRDVLDQVRAGTEIVVEHYNKPIARIVPIQEPAMTAITLTRENVAAWLGEDHGLSEEGLSALVNRVTERTRWYDPASDRQRVRDDLWWWYQHLLKDEPWSTQERLAFIHSEKRRTNVDPWETT